MPRPQLCNLRKGGALCIKGRNIIHHGVHLQARHGHHAHHNHHGGNMSQSEVAQHKGASAHSDYISTKKRISPIKYKL